MKSVVNIRYACGAYPFKISLVVEPVPDVLGIYGHVTCAVAFHRLTKENVRLHVQEYPAVSASFRLISQHTPDLSLGAVIIALMVSSECSSEQVVIYVHGLVHPVRFGNSDHKDSVAVVFIKLYIFLIKQIDADLFPVVDCVPEIL